MSTEFLERSQGPLDAGVGDRKWLNGRGLALANGSGRKGEFLNRAVRPALICRRALMIADAIPKAKCKLSANGSKRTI